MEVNIADLTWSSFVYPRGGKNEKTVEAYVEALTIGPEFPPIKIQRVFNYPKDNEKKEATLILDGIHRWHAFKECGLKKINVIEWKENPVDYETSQTALLLEAAECNTKHGDRLSPRDKKQVARDIATSDPECTWTEEALAQKLGVIQQTGKTPLHWAALRGHEEVVETLIANDADVNAKDKDGFTPLHFAISNGHKKVARILEGAGAIQ